MLALVKPFSTNTITKIIADIILQNLGMMMRFLRNRKQINKKFSDLNFSFVARKQERDLKIKPHKLSFFIFCLRYLMEVPVWFRHVFVDLSFGKRHIVDRIQPLMVKALSLYRSGTIFLARSC